MPKPAKPNPVRVLVSSIPGDLAAAASKFERHGMKVHAVMNAVGIVAGEIEADKLDALRKLPGIKVELDDAVQIPPPDAPLQ